MRRHLYHAPGVAGGAHAQAFAGEGDKVVVPAVIAASTGKIVHGILQKHVPQCAVWAFSSRVKCTAKNYSDLDLAVITDQPLSLNLSASLHDDFSESDLPWRVDVVDWTTTSESFRKIIERNSVFAAVATQSNAKPGVSRR